MSILSILVLPLLTWLFSSIPSICQEEVSEVLFCIDRIVRPVSHEIAKGHAFESIDSVHLGQALDQVILYNKDSRKSRDDLIEVFEHQLTEAGQGREEIWFGEWQVQIGWRTDALDPICALDPAEDVDQTNWRERGYFRYLAAKSKSQDAEKASESTESEADEDLWPSLLESGVTMEEEHEEKRETINGRFYQ